ncbi:PAS domain S-box protein [Fulvivirga sp. 29W222]|uniref:histidine kinase n=1 Tax=Fulvivirga marina TaxID=2494733 RepID=A0A937G5M9_9BACT|nr:PAS domain-containing sensor histidine kinase [Fulvivirga marina]MBL6448871.1 PAS domain S-box protein [Fulvivirga marina]
MSKEIEDLKAEVKRLKALVHQNKSSGGDQTFKDLFDNSTDLIYIHDENGVFIDVNQAVVDKYGYSKEEVIGNTPVMFSAPNMNDIEDVESKIKIVWEGGVAQSVEWWSIKRDQGIFLKELILRKGRYFGRDVIVATGRDITERKAVENQLLKNNKELKNLNATLDAFVYSASHDLKAPLLSVKGLLNLMEVDHDTDPDYYLERIKLAIEKLADFVNDLVEYSRNTRTEVKVERVNFNRLLIEVFHNFEFLPEDQQIKKIINIDPIDDFYSDRYRIFIILNNLVSNAIRYSDLDKETSYMKISITRDRSAVVISVEDNGIGIAKEHFENIFNMFYRATDVKTGSGLGLYIVKETLLKLSGTIKCTSEVKEGTCFEIRLPSLQ